MPVLDDAIVDLRSDTVTKPTPAMRKAMAEADVGDDVYREDPTVRRLEEAFAQRVGMSEALFVPSGTMANQIALRLLYRPGSVAIAGAHQHVVAYEAAAAARNSGVQFLAVADTAGILAPADVSWAGQAADHHQPAPSVVCVENTHMASGGMAWRLDELEAISSVAKQAGFGIHMDGARLFNAEVATGVGAAEYCGLVTTVMCCLSKGLCAPVGSLLAGPSDLMAEARVERARLGGGMRQAGVLAAAGLIAISDMVDRLGEDHVRAERLAEAVGQRWPLHGAAGTRHAATNMVVFDHPDPDTLLGHLDSSGIRGGTIAPGVVRLVTHHDVDDAGVERALTALSSAP